MTSSTNVTDDQTRGESESRSEPPELPDGFKRGMVGQLLTEFGPLLIFFIAFMALDILWATALYTVATVVAVAVTYARSGKLPTLPLISAGLLVIFGGLTLVLNDDAFIKIKPTVTNGFYGVALLVGWFVGFRLIDRILGSDVSLDEDGQRALTLRTAGYLIGLAVLNEIVWRTMPTDAWVVFKVFVMVGLNLAFAWSQFPLLRRHLVAQ